jgi:hypothetical protein
MQDLIIYTDGSGHYGNIGAAIYSPTINGAEGEYIGTEGTHNVYTAKLIVIQMAVTLFEEKGRAKRFHFSLTFSHYHRLFQTFVLSFFLSIHSLSRLHRIHTTSDFRSVASCRSRVPAISKKSHVDVVAALGLSRLLLLA